MTSWASCSPRARPALPKGAMHTHRSLLTEIDIVLRMFNRDDLAALLNSFPMFHHSGIAAPLMFLLSGGKARAAGAVRST